MTETAIFGGGCFWCTEAIFQSLKGVESVLPGYAGGKMANPNYQNIGDHAEVIKIEFSPQEISFDQLLTVFFATHDPTTINRQGADVGSQYRSAVYWKTPEQRDAAEAKIAELNSVSADGEPIVTEVKPLDKFYPAEDYHQNYYAQNTNSVYCQVVINPKLTKLKKEFAQLLKDKTA